MSKKVDPNDKARKLGPDGLARELDRQTKDAAPVGADRNGNLVKPILIRASDVQPESISWLWDPYLPAGKLSILQGNPGDGKTFIALAVSAIISRGWPFPGVDGKPGQNRDPGNVLYLGMEDGIGDTMRPRLDALEADADRIFFLKGFTKRKKDNERQTEEVITFQDVEALRAAFVSVNPALMVADPIQGFLGRNVDFHRANEIRPVLAGLAKLAEEFRCAVLCISHLRKGEADKAIYRGLGSIDIVAAARSVLLVGRDPENPNKRGLVHIKSSLAQEGASIGYAIENGRLEWTGLSDLTADKLFAPEAGRGERSVLEEAKTFLEEILEGGPLPPKEISSQAKEIGISERTLKRAKSEMNLESYRESAGNKGDGRWLWSLPKDAELESSPNREHGPLVKALQEPEAKEVMKGSQQGQLALLPVR